MTSILRTPKRFPLAYFNKFCSTANAALLILMFLAIFLFMANTAKAHPGRTDSNGGHTCRTNCERWGYDYGEYHYHGGSGARSTPSYTSPPPVATPAPTPTPVAPVYTPPQPSTSTNAVPDTTSQNQSSTSTGEDTDYSWLWWVGIIGLFGWGWYADSDKKNKNSRPSTYTSSSSFDPSINSGADTCPRCGGTLRRINGRRGPFYGCSNFRTKNCRYTKSA